MPMDCWSARFCPWVTSPLRNFSSRTGGSLTLMTSRADARNGNLKWTALEQCPNAFVRYAYAYDAQGNWTERVTWKRSVPDGDFLPSKIDRRTIEYFDAASGEG